MRLTDPTSKSVYLGVNHLRLLVLPILHKLKQLSILYEMFHSNSDGDDENTLNNNGKLYLRFKATFKLT